MVRLTGWRHGTWQAKVDIMMAMRGTDFDDAALDEPGRAVVAGRGPVTRMTAATILSLGILVAVNSIAMSGSHPYRWWADFIIIPGLVFLTLSVGLPRAAPETRFVLAWIGAVVLAVALLLMAGKMGEYWPLMIVVPCLGPTGLFALRPADASVRAFVNTVAGLALVGVALGLAFLLIRAGAIDPGDTHWWSFAMLAAAGVTGANGLILLATRRGTYWFSMAVLLIALGTYTTLAAVAELTR
jgi:hypothetical protein